MFHLSMSHPYCALSTKFPNHWAPPQFLGFSVLKKKNKLLMFAVERVVHELVKFVPSHSYTEKRAMT